MRFPFAKLLAAALMGVLAAAQSATLPEVVERTLPNGFRILLVERPGTGAAHLRLFIQGGRANAGGLPPAAADLLARTLFRRTLPEEVARALAPLLAQEDGSFEALRLERLRLVRQPAGTASLETQPLQAMHDRTLASILDKVGPLETWDALDALGASHREIVVGADFLAHGADVPASAVAVWSQIEAGRFRRLPMGRFPLEREALVRELDGGKPPCPPSLSALLGTALAGHPYASAADFQRSGVEALSLEDMETYAHWRVVPEHATLVVVGDVRAATVLPVLEKAFGALGRGTLGAIHHEELPGYRNADAAGSLETPGGRHLTVGTSGDTRIFFAWRVPPANHPDGPALRALAQVLGGSPSSRLNQNLGGPRGVARNLTVQMGVPGEKDGNLLVIEAEPAEGRSLGELELAIQTEILRVQREPVPDAEVRRAQAQMEAAQILIQEDAGVLAEALGAAQCQGGDWRLAFRALVAGRDLKAGAIQAAARSYLGPARLTVAQFGPDPLLQPLDRTETRMLQVLTALVQRKLGDEAQSQVVLREALRQLRMLSPAEREQTLRLLEAQVKP